MAEPMLELDTLLQKNVKFCGLTKEEERRAAALIACAKETDKDCPLCRGVSGTPDKAIENIGLCKGHTYYTLFTRK